LTATKTLIEQLDDIDLAINYLVKFTNLKLNNTILLLEAQCTEDIVHYREPLTAQSQVYKVREKQAGTSDSYVAPQRMHEHYRMN
jgi:hypothetical protein